MHLVTHLPDSFINSELFRFVIVEIVFFDHIFQTLERSRNITYSFGKTVIVIKQILKFLFEFLVLVIDFIN